MKGLNQDNLNMMCLYVNDLLITISIRNGIENLKFNTKTKCDFIKLRGLSSFTVLNSLQPHWT